MVNYCVCGGCKNNCLSGQRMHYFPDREKCAPTFRAWVHFVQAKRKNFSANSVTSSSMICGAHFKKEDYDHGDLMAMEMGFKKRSNVRLIPGAVPSIHAASLCAGVAEHNHRATSSITKRRLASTLGEVNATQDTQAAPTFPDVLNQETHSSFDLLPKTADRVLQCNIRPPHRSFGVQVEPRMVNVGTQTDESPLTSTPLKQILDYSDDHSSDFNQRYDSSWCMEEDEDMDCESSEVEESQEEMQNDSMDSKSADKLIVCKAQLMSLFATCPACFEETSREIIQQEGTFVKINQTCAACGFEREWQNQPKLHNMPLCNLMLSGAIHFSGCMPTQTLRMLKLLGLQCINIRTYFRHQQFYTVPCITEVWKSEQASILEQLKEMDDGLILSGDCRSDSPGHCAKYGSYTVIEERLNKILDVQLVQSSEVPHSNWCELEGLKRCIHFLAEQQLHVSTIITDRNRQVAKWVREKLCPQGTKHFFDIWHISKGLKKALDSASKERCCEDLNLWQPAIINHLYWTAASTPDGNPDVMEAKWASLVNHVQDIHNHESPWFPVCAHSNLEGEARNKQWLQPGSMAAIKLESVATRHAFLKDVRQLSPQHQTFSLEAFHSLILHFAPKHTGFTYLGIHSRILLAALHFNSNSNREVHRTSEGEVSYAVRYPRFRKGQWVVRPIKESPSYEYAISLMEHLTESYTRSPTVLRESSAVFRSCAPNSLTASFQTISKEEAVHQYLAKQSRFTSR